MANSWLRLWHDMPNDPKWRTIARAAKQPITNVISVYVHMLVCASNATERGRTQGWNDEDVASALDINLEDVVAIRGAMQGRVMEDDYLTGWEKRQPKKEDNSAGRAKEWRDNQKAERNRTQPNAKKRPDKDTDKDNSSVTNVTSEAQDALASNYDFKKVFFTEGLKMIGGDTKPNRSLIGQWLRDYGEDALSTAFMAAQKQSAVEPKAYIVKTLREKSNANAGKYNQYAKPTWKSEGQRLAEKYEREAQLEEQGGVDSPVGANLRLAEAIREDSTGIGNLGRRLLPSPA